MRRAEAELGLLDTTLVDAGQNSVRLFRALVSPRRRTPIKTLLARLVRDVEGQDLIEYGLLLGIITAACVASIKVIGPKVAVYFSNLNAKLP